MPDSVFYGGKKKWIQKEENTGIDFLLFPRCFQTLLIQTLYI